MRRSEFRVWDIENKKMLYYDKDVVPNMTLNGVLIASTPGNVSHNVSINFKIMQFTGVIIKHDQKIYEGDIIEATLSDHSLPTMGKIVFYDAFGAFANENEGGKTLLHNMHLNSFEILGNIFETPELLKKMS